MIRITPRLFVSFLKNLLIRAALINRLKTKRPNAMDTRRKSKFSINISAPWNRFSSKLGILIRLNFARNKSENQQIRMILGIHEARYYIEPYNTSTTPFERQFLEKIKVFYQNVGPVEQIQPKIRNLDPT